MGGGYHHILSVGGEVETLDDSLLADGPGVVSVIYREHRGAKVLEHGFVVRRFQEVLIGAVRVPLAEALLHDRALGAFRLGEFAQIDGDAAVDDGIVVDEVVGIAEGGVDAVCVDLDSRRPFGGGVHLVELDLIFGVVEEAEGPAVWRPLEIVDLGVHRHSRDCHRVAGGHLQDFQLGVVSLSGLTEIVCVQTESGHLELFGGDYLGDGDIGIGLAVDGSDVHLGIEDCPGERCCENHLHHVFRRGLVFDFLRPGAGEEAKRQGCRHCRAFQTVDFHIIGVFG